MLANLDKRYLVDLDASTATLLTAITTTGRRVQAWRFSADERFVASSGTYLALVPTAGAALTPLRTATSLAMSRETSALRGRGATVTTIVPDDASLKAMGPNLMDASRRDAVATAGYAQGRRVA